MKGATNFITKGLKKLSKQKSKDSWQTIHYEDDKGEVIPNSQETQDEGPLERLTVEQIVAAARAHGEVNDDDDDKEQEEGENAEEEDDDDALLPTQGNAASQEPLTLIVPTSADEGTPPNVPGSLLDPELTPKSPCVTTSTEVEVYKLQALASMGGSKDPFYVPPPAITSKQFEAQVQQSKENTGNIVDEDIWESSPAIIDEKVTFGTSEVQVVRRKFKEIGHMFGGISPHMATNPELLAEIMLEFFSGFVSHDWANVPVHGMTLKTMMRKYDKYVTIVEPTRASASSDAMEVDSSTPRIPAAAKGKGKAIPTSPLVKEAAPIKPGSPIKISAVPRPLPLNPGPSKVAGTKGNRNPAWVAKLSGKNVYEAHFDSITQATLEEGRSQSRDTQSAAPQRDNSSARILRDNLSSKAKPPLPPVPIESRPTTHATFMACAQTTAQGHPSCDKPKCMSYAQTAALQKNAAVIPTLSAESIQWAKELQASFPKLSVQEALEYSILLQQLASLPTLPQSKHKTAVAERQQGISNGLNRKSTQFAFSHLIQPEQFSDMGRIINEMNRHLTATSPVMRVQNSCLFKSVVHFYLNVAPTRAQFDCLKECLFKVLQKEAPTQGSDDPFAPQSIAHLIMKGFDYYTNVYNRCPKDILTSEQIMEKMQGVDQFRGLECVRPPAVVRSKGSNDMAIAFFDVWDSKNGIRTKELVNKVYHIGGKLIKLEYARQHEFVPQCQNCWSWTHDTSRCRINHQQCAQCGQPHKTKNHDLFATCCGAVKKTDDYTGECAHPLKCINCKGAHLASNSKCVYKHHQNNVTWHNQRRKADYKALHEKRECQKTNITQTLQEGVEIIEVTSSSE
jgi:hypothetical protein